MWVSFVLEGQVLDEVQNETGQEIPTQAATERPTRERKKPTQLTYDAEFCQSAQAHITGDIFAQATAFRLQEVSKITAIPASADPDTMYFHQAMAEPDSEEFMKAIIKEFKTMLETGIIRWTKTSELPKGADVFPAVWAMKRKRKVLNVINIGGEDILIPADEDNNWVAPGELRRWHRRCNHRGRQR